MAKATNNKRQISRVSDFKKKSGGNEPRDLELPSGLRCSARRVRLDNLLAGGKVPNALLPMMRGALVGKRADLSKVDVTEEMITEMLKMTDMVVVECVVEPPVFAVPANESDRDDELLYVDEIDLVDRQFIFQWALGGVTDLARFRGDTEAIVATLPAGQGMVD